MKITLAQTQPDVGDLATNVNNICDLLTQASEVQSKLVLFPELSLSGYVTNQRILEITAIAENDNYIRKIKQSCEQNNIDTVISFPEIEGQSYYITSLYIDHNGETLAKYRKTHLFADEQKLFNKGEDYPVFNTQFAKLGMMICYDLEFPEVARLLKLQGAEMILISTANMQPYEHHQDVYLMSRALENEVPVAIANQVGINEPHHFFGHSAVVDHNGQFLLKLDNVAQVQHVNVNLNIARDADLDYVNNLHSNIYQKLSSVKESV
ncbi:carbon-nitrogen hydrolase family protein [Staphylococcus kloosii]|jgi:predicted amidohydrolase|uniref:carbon-nitrogen hydrolase family protein n=1 Tax=Staphylococcus kloosii TaxID=29384 RepID=UPI001E6326BC|nr:carbon-nitrogen hydrolase family protein [Staphylococcus kloosii]MCD8879021.1 carbon-nitrogen hydrolase family protein [Staphylococcus kloosii]